MKMKLAMLVMMITALTSTAQAGWKAGVDASLSKQSKASDYTLRADGKVRDTMFEGEATVGYKWLNGVQTYAGVRHMSVPDARDGRGMNAVIVGVKYDWDLK
jgi:hypothetical protein